MVPSTWIPALLVLILTLLTYPVASDWTATPFNAPSYPLAVRTPYLSAWHPSPGGGVALNHAWPEFWTGATLGWAGFVRIDGVAYSFLGDSSVSNFTKASQTSAKFTSTRSIFVLSAGPVDLTVTFLSPIEPDHLVKQSLPFSYLSVSAASNDNSAHDVSIYTDITGEWLSTDHTASINWTTTAADEVITHQSQLQHQTVYTEDESRILQGSVYYSTRNADGATFQTGHSTTVRSYFIQHGKLANTRDTNYRAINNDWPAFGFARALGKVTKESPKYAVFSVGHVRDPVVKYIQKGDTFEGRSYYFWSAYSTVHGAIKAFLEDYLSALSRADSLDDTIRSAAEDISSQYADIVALSMRQTLGATELTISGSPGSWNTDDVLMFIKEISSDGNINTVDIIMPAWPAFMYLNPKLGKYMLLPLLQYQATGQYPNTWAVHDMGAHYPIANGHNLGSDEKMPIEECGNMIIMMLDYTQRSGDHSLVKKYSKFLTQWADYLVKNTLIPVNQLSTVDFAGPLPNQTNLAIKGIIGIKAMSVISKKYLDDSDAASSYSSTAASYLKKWKTYGISSDETHLTLEYGKGSTNVLAFNLAMDKLLGLNFIPDSVNSMQSTYYKNHLEKYGFPIDSRSTYTSAEWMIWTSMTTSDSVRDSFIKAIHKWLSSGTSDTPFTDRFDDTTGAISFNKNRPVIGGNLALLL